MYVLAFIYLCLSGILRWALASRPKAPVIGFQKTFSRKHMEKNRPSTTVTTAVSDTRQFPCVRHNIHPDIHYVSVCPPGIPARRWDLLNT